MGPRHIAVWSFGLQRPPTRPAQAWAARSRHGAAAGGHCCPWWLMLCRCDRGRHCARRPRPAVQGERNRRCTARCMLPWLRATAAVRHARFQGPLSLARQCHESHPLPALQVFSDPARAGKGVFSDVKVRWGLGRLCLLPPGVVGCRAGPPVAQDPAPAATQACKEVGRSKLRLTGQQGHLTDSVELEQVARVNVRHITSLLSMHLTRVAGVKHRQPRSRCLCAVLEAPALQQRAHPAANRSVPPGAAPAG